MTEKESRNSFLEEKHSAKRRAWLKRLAAGGGITALGRTLPENWTQPAVDAILLPAHAQATGLVLQARLTVGDTPYDDGTYDNVSNLSTNYAFEVFVVPPQAIPVTIQVTGIEADRGDSDSGTAGDAIRTFTGTTSDTGTIVFNANDADDTPDSADGTLAMTASSGSTPSTSSVVINWA